MIRKFIPSYEKEVHSRLGSSRKRARPGRGVQLQSEISAVQAISSGNSVVGDSAIALGIEYESTVGPLSLVPKA